MNETQQPAVAGPVEPTVKPARWWKCDTHGPAKAGAWGCPECVSEMRAELMFTRRVLFDLMQTGEAWLAAASFAEAASEGST